MTDLRNKEKRILSESDAIEDILRNHIDNPILGEITLEALRERNIKSLVFWKLRAIPIEHEVTDTRISFMIPSSLVGVRQGDHIITPDGTKKQITPELMANCYEEFLKS
jgi:hypothetical protein